MDFMKLKKLWIATRQNIKDLLTLESQYKKQIKKIMEEERLYDELEEVNRMLFGKH